MPTLGKQSTKTSSSTSPEENLISLHFYMPNVRLLLRRPDFSLKETMKKTNTNINVPHQSTTIDERPSEVSIFGQLDNVRKAREVLNEEALMKYAFPINFQPDIYEQDIEKIESDYEVQIEFLERHGFNKYLVLIKSVQNNWVKLQEATEKLLELFLGEGQSEDVTINTVIELPVGCHNILASDLDFINKVEKKTQTRIKFPTMEEDSAKNLQIKLGGSIKGTYIARALLLSKLPVKMCINCPGISKTIIDNQIGNLKIKYSISFEVNKILDDCSILLQGTENNIEELFIVSQEILKFIESTKIHSKELRKKKVQTTSNQAVTANKSPIEDTKEYNDILKRANYRDLFLTKFECFNKKTTKNSDLFRSSEELKNLYNKNNDALTRIFKRDIKISSLMDSCWPAALPDLLISASSRNQENALSITTEPLCSLVEALLEHLQLEHYGPIFEKFSITMKTLSKMTDCDLARIGVCSSGARRLILRAVDIIKM